MIFQLFTPAAPLRPYIHAYHYLKGGETPIVQRLVSNGCMGLNFCRNQSIRFGDYGTMATCLGGPRTDYFDVATGGGLEMVGVEFQPYGARMFFDMPMSDLFNLLLTPSDLNDADLTVLEEQVMTADSVATCFRIFDAFFIRRLRADKRREYNRQRIAAAFHTVGQQSESTAVGDMAQAACLSTKQFNRLFTDFVGITPKKYLRLYRFHEALRHLKAGCLSLTETAWQSGYYDQAHMTREFKDLSGFAPSFYEQGDRSACDPFSWMVWKAQMGNREGA
ncbi:MAG: helix-turn-helix transcriptional regulator [Alloprevotella sp.]|nr:helix-turn-helix transcriptional regulator [Alloprevotella sp.]